MAVRYWKRIAISLLLLSSVGFAIGGEARIDSLQPGQPIAADLEVLITPSEGEFLKGGTVEQALDGWVVMRRKSGANSYTLHAGRYSEEFISKVRAFELGQMTPEQALNTRFYRKLRQPKFQDEALIYVDDQYVYCTGLTRLYYTDSSNNWHELNAVKVGLINLRAPDDRCITMKPREPGWNSLLLQEKGKFPRLVGFSVAEKAVTKKVVKLSASIDPDLSAIKKSEYEWTDGKDDALLQAKVDSIKNEIKEIQISLSRQVVVYDSLFGEPDEFPLGTMASLNATYLEYVNQFENHKKESFSLWAAPLIERTKYLLQQRKNLEAKIDSLAQEVRVVETAPTVWRYRAVKGVTGIWDFRLKIDALQSQLEGIWKGRLYATPEQMKRLVADLEAKKEGASPLRVEVTYRNKTALVKKGDEEVRRFYRIEGVAVEREGDSLLFVGTLELPDYVRNAPEVVDYLNRTQMALEQARIDELARQQTLLQTAQKERQERLRRAMEYLRGEVVEIPGGTFTYKDATVEMSPFAIGATEMTQEVWDRFYGKSSPSKYKDPRKPVTNVDWYAASTFCKEIGGDLPTEAQWEYAARAGTNEYFYWGPKEGPSGVNYAVFRENSRKHGKKSRHYGPWKVASLRPNAWGVFDMAGNVTEWVKDYHSIWNVIREHKDPQGATSSLMNHFKVIKGGSWKDKKAQLQHEKSDWEDPRYRSDAIGFRCVFPANQQLTIEEIEKKLRTYVGDTVEVLPSEIKIGKPPKIASEEKSLDREKTVSTQESSSVTPQPTHKRDTTSVTPQPPLKQDTASVAPSSTPEQAPPSVASQPAPEQASSSEAPQSSPEEETPPKAESSDDEIQEKAEVKESKPAVESPAAPAEAKPSQAESEG